MERFRATGPETFKAERRIRPRGHLRALLPRHLRRAPRIPHLRHAVSLRRRRRGIQEALRAAPVVPVEAPEVRGALPRQAEAAREDLHPAAVLAAPRAPPAAGRTSYVGPGETIRRNRVMTSLFGAFNLISAF